MAAFFGLVKINESLAKTALELFFGEFAGVGAPDSLLEDISKRAEEGAPNTFNCELQLASTPPCPL